MKAKLSPEEIEVLHEGADRVYFDTHYNFLKAHNGFRPGCMHMFMGTSHGGKSTLVRSLLTDICLSGKDINGEPNPVLLWLSEETVLEFLLPLAERL